MLRLRLRLMPCCAGVPAVCLLLTAPAGVPLQLIDLFRSYFEGALNENSIKRNFVLMYELLDEVMDFGFPQVTEPSVLKNFIFQKGIRGEIDLVSGMHPSTQHPVTPTHSLTLYSCRVYPLLLLKQLPCHAAYQARLVG